MTNEKILEKIIAIKDANVNNSNVEILCNDLIIKLQDEIRDKEAKKAGKLDELKAAKRILKRNDDKMPALQYAKTIDDMQYIMNRWQIIKLVNPLQLPELPEGLEFPDVLKFLPTCKKDIDLELPDMAELKTYVKLQKLEHKKDKNYVCFYDFGKGLPFVNAELLIDMMEALPEAKASVNKSWNDMLYFCDDNGNSGGLCPMRPPENVQRCKTVLV